MSLPMVQVPSGLPRIVELPDSEGGRRVILLEEIIERNMNVLFLNYDIVSAHPFRIMRNADFTLDEEEAVDLLEEIQKQLKKRQWGEVIRLEVEEKVDKRPFKNPQAGAGGRQRGYLWDQRPVGSDLPDEDVWAAGL